jgi:peptidyl-prolyl cis-trans isomerase C
MTLAALLLCPVRGPVLTRPALLPVRASCDARRAAAPAAGLFDKIGEIMDYNVKYAKAAADQAFDKRRARASHILLKTTGAETDAWLTALRAKIDARELTFADAASQYSTCPSASEGGDLGTFGPGAMVPEFDAAVFNEAVPLGAMQKVTTKFGTHLLRVVERSEMEKQEGS